MLWHTVMVVICWCSGQEGDLRAVNFFDNPHESPTVARPKFKKSQRPRFVYLFRCRCANLVLLVNLLRRAQIHKRRIHGVIALVAGSVGKGVVYV